LNHMVVCQHSSQHSITSIDRSINQSCVHTFYHSINQSIITTCNISIALFGSSVALSPSFITTLITTFSRISRSRSLFQSSLTYHHPLIQNFHFQINNVNNRIHQRCSLITPAITFSVVNVIGFTRISLWSFHPRITLTFFTRTSLCSFHPAI
jgi:hypothetical protein